MAWYPIIYACGHDDHVQIYGPTKDRQRKADWIASKECPSCQQTRRDAASAAAAEANAHQGLPTLIGSSKQVAWAETIRAQKLPEVDAFAAEVLAKNPNLTADQRAQFDSACAALRSEAQAGWWIEHRDFGPFACLQLIAKRYPESHQKAR